MDTNPCTEIIWSYPFPVKRTAAVHHVMHNLYGTEHYFYHYRLELPIHMPAIMTTHEACEAEYERVT